MGKKTMISMAVVRRLPKYYRYLGELLRNDVERISSKELSERIGFTASQIRQDLNNFGDFGQQGYGYNVRALYEEIGKILGLNKNYNTVIVGAGNIGQAVANYTNFERLGFHLVGIFDRNPKLIGISIRDKVIQDVDNLEEFLKNNHVDIGIICVPKEQAQKIADIFVKCGIKAIWNFAPTDLNVPDDVIVENVHLSESLLTLSYRLNEAELFKEKIGR
ncbi:MULTISPECIES: redox-sensing transcriptional repressor Rex [Caloramator]|uniref:Redox-sensing transcriptional repressor Rex n=1 Tax=Caloramator australicus RC3 TaxID=857293 RepID=I7LKM1_9CLOT|nr:MULTISPECIES: redox-sensing transcriptional repressor Rex [Caloramator]MDO6356014.1 redox-sensing transcriptional repressor Rex [Caloramator sp. CAR-1]CCJ34565.1 Redox-sensitive transcriptional regulator (AT-rich DNA-binding protein) [Caloramator australicus RC3]